MQHFTHQQIRQAIVADQERLFAFYAMGRPENWSCDTRTKDLVCLTNWLSEQLIELVRQKVITDEDRKIQQHNFYRWARSENDLFELATQVINDAIDGKIDRERKPHRRWG